MREWVAISHQDITVSRWSDVSGQMRRTHFAHADEPQEFTVEFVEEFRRFPPPEFYVGAPNSPTGGDDGGSPAAMSAAAA